MASAEFPAPIRRHPPVPVPLTVRGANRILRLLWTSNPFYVISAALFLFGLKLSFDAQTSELESWALMGGLGLYTLLLTAAALCLVRFARVWNDVRTVLLLVVLMFLATSVTFDELLVMKPERGQWFFLGGLVFAVVLTESLLRGIRLRLPLAFRLPYHLIVALFFLYPLVLVPVLDNPHGEVLMWALWGFAPAAGLVFLTLIPAVRKTRSYVKDNGSPWPWPYFPWSMFVFLALAVCGRAFLLCWSFQPLPDLSERIIFAPYFLIPLGLAIAAILLEVGIVEESRWTRWMALVIPLALLPIATLGHRDERIYREFLGHFANRLGGTPLYTAVIAAGGFYAYGCIRRVPQATEGLTVIIVAMAFVGPETLQFVAVRTPQVALLASAVLLQLCLGLLRRDGWRIAVGAAACSWWVASSLARGYRELREVVPGLDYMTLGLALLPVAVVISLGKGALARRMASREESPQSSY